MQSKGEEIFVQILKIGDGGAEVSLLQKGLVRAGFGPLRLDGIFGPATERALRAFQRAADTRTVYPCPLSTINPSCREMAYSQPSRTGRPVSSRSASAYHFSCGR